MHLCKCFLLFIIMNKEGAGMVLFTLSSLMSCTGQKLFMFMFSHLFSSFFDYATQQTTSNLDESLLK